MDRRMDGRTDECGVYGYVDESKKCTGVCFVVMRVCNNCLEHL